MKSLGVLDIFCTIWDISTTSRQYFNFDEILHIFEKKKIFYKNLQISKSAEIGHAFMIFCLFHVYLGPNPIICKISTLRWCSSRYFQYFSWVCHFFENYYIPLGTHSSSRGVLRSEKFFHQKVWSLSFRTHRRTSL